MAKKLLEAFHSLDQHVKRSLSEISNSRLLALAALELAETEAGIDRLSAEHIVACLEAAGVAVKKLSISRSLASAAGFISSRREEGEVFYKIMTKGKSEIEPFLSRSKLSVVRIEKDQPRTARIELKETFALLKGEVRICDPYYGIRTLDALDYIPTKCTIKFLSVNPTDSITKLVGAIKDFKKERPKSEFRVADKTAGLHDRFVVTDTCLIILGHGLKDIGGKESFLIRLDQSLVPDLVKASIQSFDDKWNNATAI
jgi:hypothetical protein